MQSENIVLSYPRSGNHLCRFFIELLSEIPTYGCKGNKDDKEIYKNNFPEKVPFNIRMHFDSTDCYRKYHMPPPKNANKLILIIRNPKEVLLRQNNYKINMTNNWFSYQKYFENIEFYNNHVGPKIILFYEDMLTDKISFINTLYDFLEINNPKKKDYVIANIDKLFELSSKGTNRAWGGVLSNGETEFYYKKIPDTMKTEFDLNIDKFCEKYPFLKEKYNI